MEEFKGFSKNTIKFLNDLKRNNNKPWFDANKGEYEDFLLNPMKLLVENLGDYMQSIDYDFIVKPAINKTVSRIYRDARFSKNKTPFKTSMWLTFKRQRKDWKDFPTFFFEILPDGYSYGMGFFNAQPATMRKFREAIDNNLDEFEKVKESFDKQNVFILEGEKYKRIIDSSKSAQLLDWYQRRQLYFMCWKGLEGNLYGEKLIDELINGFEKLKDFYWYLMKIKSIR